MTTRVWLAVAIVAVPLLAYPLITLAGGAPRFPTRGECVRPAVAGEPADVVYGRFDSLTAAEELRQHVVSVGFTGTEVLGDGCGRWKVLLLNVPSVEIAEQVRDEARTVGLDPKLERATSG